MDPLAKKLGSAVAGAVRQQIKDIGAEVKKIPDTGTRQVTGKDDESDGDPPDGGKSDTLSGKQQLLVLLRGSAKPTPQGQTAIGQQKGDDSQTKRQNYLEKDMQKAKQEREERERQRRQMLEQGQEQMPQERAFTAPKGRKQRGMTNPLARKGSQKHELGKTAKG